MSAAILSSPSVHPLAGKTAVVAGASQGIGRATALALARCGVRVHAIARDREALEAIAGQVDTIVPQPADLADDDALQRIIQLFGAGAERAELLVYSAGTIVHAPTREAKLDDLDAQLQINFRAAYVLTQGLLPALIESRGDVVFVNSSVTQFPRAQSGQFAATQHALKGFANSLREEVNDLGVRVLSIYPGRTATPRQKNLCKASGREYLPDAMLQPEDVAEILVTSLCLPRRAEVTEIRLRPSQKS